MDAAVSVELFVEILNQYVYYYDQENDAVSATYLYWLPKQILIAAQVTTKYINGLIELIHSNLSTTEVTPALDAPKRHFQRTLDFIASRDYEGVVTQAKTWAILVQE